MGDPKEEPLLMNPEIPKKGSAAEKRRKALIGAAYGLFVEKGYGSVSVDEIVKVAGGSKSTIYSLFGSKEGVMKAVIESLAEEMLDYIKVGDASGKNTREVLVSIGEMLVDLALSENAISQFRLAVANAKPFPDVAKLWFDSGPRATMNGIAEFMAEESAKGKLNIKDPLMAAWHFSGMVLLRENMVRLVGAPPAKRKEMMAWVREAVDAFLRAYGP